MDDLQKDFQDLRKDFQGLMDLVLMELRSLVQEAQVLHRPRPRAGGRHNRRASRQCRSSSETLLEGPPAASMPILPEDSLGERISQLDEAIEHETTARMDLEERLHRRLEASLQELRGGSCLSRGSAPNVLEEKLRSQPATSPVIAGQPRPHWHLAVKNMLEEHPEKMPVEMMASAERVRLRLADCWRRNDSADVHTKALPAEHVVTDVAQQIKAEHSEIGKATEISAANVINNSANEISVVQALEDGVTRTVSAERVAAAEGAAASAWPDRAQS